MGPRQIKAAIALAGTTQTAIATHLGVSTKSVSKCIEGQMRSARIEAALAQITGKPIHTKKSKPGRPKTSWDGKASGVVA